MDKTSLYIQKLIVLILVLFTGAILSHNIKIYYLLPAMFFTLALLVSKITGQKPDYLFGLSKSDEFLNKKSGFWLLFKWILILFGLVYDILAWVIFGIFIFYTIILDFILLIKTVLFWIIHAILWFLKQFVPPLVFIYKMIIYYVFRWNWWIYKISFHNMRKSVSRNFYIISLWGAVFTVFILLLFYGVGILIGLPQIAFVGAVFSVLPLVWSYGEISSLRLQGAVDEEYYRVRNNFKSGYDAIRAVLTYFIIVMLLVLAEVTFDALGWIPQVGFSFMGLALNINTLASLLLIFVLVILVFAKLILPPHVVYHKDFNPDINGSINFLGVIGKRFLRYILSGIPTSFFGTILTVVPAIIVVLSVVITLNLKNNLLDSRINILNQRCAVLEGLEKFKSEKQIDRLKFYRNYPQNMVKDFRGLKSLRNTVKNLDENILKREKEIDQLSMEFSAGIDTLNKRMEDIKSRPMADSTTAQKLSSLQELKHKRLDNFSDWKQDAVFSLDKMKAELSDKSGILWQLPLVFLFTIIWASFFLGLVLAVLISYLGNVYFELYNFKEDGKPVYFRQVISEINTKDRNQPLLGFTLLALIVIFGAFFNLFLRFIHAVI